MVACARVESVLLSYVSGSSDPLDCKHVAITCYSYATLVRGRRKRKCASLIVRINSPVCSQGRPKGKAMSNQTGSV
eukprot:6189008-Pleurochrysis_carterae.AAC.2